MNARTTEQLIRFAKFLRKSCKRAFIKISIGLYFSVGITESAIQRSSVSLNYCQRDYKREKLRNEFADTGYGQGF